MKLFLKATLMAVALGGTGHAFAGDDIFLRLSGIAGDSVDERHRAEIVLKSYTQTVSNSGTGGGGGGGAGAGRATCGEISVAKNLDISSPPLIMSVLTGTTIRDGTITFRKAGRDAFEYYTVALVGVTVSAVEQSDIAGGGVTELVKLKARQFTYTVRAQKPDGSPGAPLSFGFDCVSGSRF